MSSPAGSRWVYWSPLATCRFLFLTPASQAQPDSQDLASDFLDALESRR